MDTPVQLCWLSGLPSAGKLLDRNAALPLKFLFNKEIKESESWESTLVFGLSL